MQKACQICKPPTCIYFSLLKNRPELLHATLTTRVELPPFNLRAHEENLWKAGLNPCAKEVGKWERQHSCEIKKLTCENGHLHLQKTERINDKLVNFQKTITFNFKGKRHFGQWGSTVNNARLPLGGYMPMTTTISSPMSAATSQHYRYYSSSIFVSGRGGTASAGFDFDDDLEDRLKDVERLKAELTLRGTKIDVDKLVEDYKHYMELKAQKELWEAQREDIAQKIANIVKAQKESKVKTNVDSVNVQLLSEEGKAKKLALKDLLPRFWNIEETVMLTAVSLPNTLAEKVPELYQVIDEEYYPDNKPAEAVDHYEILKESNMVKLSNVGNKAYYLRGRIAELEQELIRHFCQQLRSKNITQMLAPEMFKTPVVEAGSLDVLDPSIIYRLLHKQETKMLYNYDFDHMFLKGASHLSFLAYFAKSLLRTEDLPVKMFVVGRSYQPETGLSKDLPGLLGALQSTKICMCGITASQEKNKELFEEFVATLYSIYRQYELPYRMVSAPSWALTGMERRRTEFQIWVPSMQQYLRIGSVSECGDYNSRRLMIRASDNGKPSTSYPVFMVHSDATDIIKMIGLLLEYKKTDTYWILPDPAKEPPSDDTPDTEDGGRLSEDIADYIT